MRLAEMRKGEGFRRPVILAFWTGEEKGLHGSRWFTQHPTWPLQRIAGNINLDQLRPIFPLELLTVHARHDTTLGDDVEAVAAARAIRVQDDPEPERGLLRRSDHWNFLRAGIPAVNFVFGYDPGSESEAIYRQWYRAGYHKPQDDLEQPIDWQAAADFNRFFYALVERVADAQQPPSWKPGSTLRSGAAGE
jgi:Zn-dependent M28 family amino/carboxypeptidase